MNTNLKKRKKAAFNTYKAVRTSISLNSIQPFGYNWQQTIFANDYESSWMEQASELKPEAFANVQGNAKQHKLISKWWENN